MTLSINCLNRTGIIAALSILLLAGCTATGSPAVKPSAEAVRLRIAVMPVENQTATVVPLGEIRGALISNLKKQGMDVLDDATAERFMEKHRVRYTAGLDTETSQAWKDEVGVDGIFMSSVDLYSEIYPPRISILARLVATGPKPRILWFDSVGLAGDDEPGFLGLTLIEDPVMLRNKAMDRLFASLGASLAGGRSPDGVWKVFAPKSSFRSPVVGKDLRLNFVSFVQRYSSGDDTVSPARIEVSLSETSGQPATVEYMVRGGTAVAGTDFEGEGGTVTFAPGEIRKTINIDIISKAVHDDDKTFDVILKNPVNTVLGSTVAHTHTIINSVPEPSVDFTTEHQRVKESAGPVKITVKLSAVTGKDVIVPFRAGGTAKTPSNYTITPSPLTIKAGTRTATIMVTPSDNGIHEEDRTVVVTMGLPRSATQGRRTISTVTIINTDRVKASEKVTPEDGKSGERGIGSTPEPAVEFRNAGSRGDETASPARIEVALSAASSKVVQVEYAVTGGTARKGRDFALLGNMLTFEPGETKKTVDLDIGNSGIYGDNKTIELSLTRSINGILGSTTKHTFTIVNTQPRPSAAFTETNQRFRKSIGRVAVPVLLSTVSGKDVIVPFTVGGTAREGFDYTITPSPLTIKAGTRSAEITIIMKGDAPVEDDKTIELRLTDPVNAHIGAPGAYALTVARDRMPTIAVVPFVNVSKKKHAGEIVMLQFVKELSRVKDVTVIEPGVVRQHLLTMRIIMYDGASLPDIEVLIKGLDADLILIGKVFDYQDMEAAAGTPKVDFSVMLVEKTSGKIIWASKSYNQGDDGVTLFDWGNINTASTMVSEMVRAVRSMLLSWRGR
jgi:TolB-like protein